MHGVTLYLDGSFISTSTIILFGMAKSMDYEARARERNRPVKYRFHKVPEVLRRDVKTALAVGADDDDILELILDVFLFCTLEARNGYEAELKLKGEYERFQEINLREWE
jgi:hypothetical protein